jgi:thymidine kinase
MKPMSTKRAAIERQKIVAYAEILEERGAFCECCESAANDMSHNYPRAPFVWLIAEKNNITVLCRGCHNDVWKQSLGIAGRMEDFAHNDGAAFERGR